MQLVAPALAVEVHEHPNTERHAVGDAELPGTEQWDVPQPQYPGGSPRPSCIERLLKGTLLTHLRSIWRAALEPGNQGERPLGRHRHQAGTGQGVLAALPRPAACRPPQGDNCDTHTHTPHGPCHATM